MKRRLFLSGLLAAVSLLPIGCHPFKDTAAAESAVKEFHDRLDKGAFKEIYDATHKDFKGASTEKDFVSLLEAIHRKLGAVQSTERTSWNINSFNFQTNVVLTYSTKFAEGDAVETFTYRVGKESSELLGYNINSAALITK